MIRPRARALQSMTSKTESLESDIRAVTARQDSAQPTQNLTVP